MVAPLHDSETDGRRIYYRVKKIGDSFSNMLILRSKWRHKELGCIISNSEKIYIWESLSPPIKAVIFYLLTSSYTKLNYFQDEIKHMCMNSHTHRNTHTPICQSATNIY